MTDIELKPAATALIDAVEQDAAGRWFIGGEDPEALASNLLSALNATDDAALVKGEELPEETIRAAYKLFMHEAQYPCSPAAMREAIEFALTSRGAGHVPDVGNMISGAGQGEAVDQVGWNYDDGDPDGAPPAGLTRRTSPAVGGGWKPDREAVARLVDPPAWEFADRWKGKPGMLPEILSETRKSLAKADAILALPAAPSQGEG